MYDSVFLVRSNHSEVDVYDSYILNLTRNFHVTTLVSPQELTSCSGYLYAADLDVGVHRVEVNFDGEFQNTSKWSRQAPPIALSALPDSDCHILVVSSRTFEVKQFSSRGYFVRDVPHQNGIHPRNAIAVRQQYILSQDHGANPRQRLSRRNTTWHVTKSVNVPPWPWPWPSFSRCILFVF